MTLSLEPCPGLPANNWSAIAGHLHRLNTAVSGPDYRELPAPGTDYALIVGSAKELIEATARVVLDATGNPLGASAKYDKVINQAHALLDRQPGQGLATDPPIREIATAAKKIALEMREVRNDHGTGHGKSTPDNVPAEVATISIDAAMLWCRWALTRLGHRIDGMPATLINDLREGTTFYGGTLARRLIAADLPNLEPTDQHALGFAVAQRAASGGTFVVRDDGVRECAKSSDLTRWPPAYRAGLVKGLFLDREGQIDTNPTAASDAALVLAAHPAADEVLNALLDDIAGTRLAYGLASDATRRAEIAIDMAGQRTLLSGADATAAWNKLIDLISGTSA